MSTFDLHVTKWALFPTADEREFTERVAAAGADGVGYLGWRDADVDALVAACEDHGIEWLSTAAGGAAGNTGQRGDPAITDPDCHDDAVAAIEETCETVGEHVENVVVTVGPDQDGVDEATQHNAIVSVLREAAPAAAAAGVTLVVEPLNPREDHPGYFLTTTDRGVEIVDAVDHPDVRLLYDIYHQQVTEGDLIARIRKFHEYIGMYHLADVPGRHEPGTGEINWENVFDAIAETGYEGTVGLEYVARGDPGETVADVVELADGARQ
jgi:hydroxypyruvate isomerase